jgi:hypothetical protein
VTAVTVLIENGKVKTILGSCARSGESRRQPEAEKPKAERREPKAEGWKPEAGSPL